MKHTNFDDEIEKYEGDLFSFNWVDALLIAGLVAFGMALLVRII